MGSISIGFLIAITMGTTHTGYLEAKQVPNFLGGDDFMIPSFEKPIPMMNYLNNNKNQRYTMVYFGGSADKNSDSTQSLMPYQITDEKVHTMPHNMFPSFQKDREPLVYEDAETIPGFQNHGPASMGRDRDYRKNPLLRYPKSISDYRQPFKMNQESTWFQRPKVSIEHVYDLGPIDADSNQDNWYQSPQALRTHSLELQDDNNSTKPQLQSEDESKKDEGSEKEEVSDEEEDWLERPKPSIDVKTIERPFYVEVLKKTGVPKPHPVEIPTPQLINVRTRHPYVVLESVPVPVAVPIYKLVPEMVEKKIPIEVEKLVPMYKEKPYKVIIEKPYNVYVKRPYPVYETIYKHVYRKKKPSYNRFVDKIHRHH